MLRIHVRHSGNAAHQKQEHCQDDKEAITYPDNSHIRLCLYPAGSDCMLDECPDCDKQTEYSDEYPEMRVCAKCLKAFQVINIICYHGQTEENGCTSSNGVPVATQFYAGLKVQALLPSDYRGHQRRHKADEGPDYQQEEDQADSKCNFE